VNRTKTRIIGLHYKILSHPLVIEVMQNASPLHSMISAKIKDSGKSGEDIQKRAHQVLSEIHASDHNLYIEFTYHNEVFHYTSNLIHAMERLEMTPIFLKLFPRTATFDKNDITIHRWIQYHYSNYIVTMISVYDTALLVVNAIFGLGIEPRKCNDRTVAKHELVKKSRVKKALDGLDSIMKPYRDPRNFFVHRNIIPGLATLDDLEGLRFIEETGKKLNLEAEPIRDPRVVKLLYNYQRQLLVKEVVKEGTRVADTVYELFDELQPVYSALSAKIKKRS
jgi:hypothetical protein